MLSFPDTNVPIVKQFQHTTLKTNFDMQYMASFAYVSDPTYMHTYILTFPSLLKIVIGTVYCTQINLFV